MNSSSMNCNVKIGNDHYYANPKDKFIIQEQRLVFSITVLIIGILTLLYVLRKEDRSIFLIIPFCSGLSCVVISSIQLKNYNEAVSDVKEYGRNCHS